MSDGEDGRSHLYYTIFFAKVVRQRCIDVTSFHMQFEKIGRGLLRKLSGVMGSALLAKIEGGN